MRIGHLPARRRQRGVSQDTMLEPFSRLRGDFENLWDEFFDLGQPLQEAAGFSAQLDVTDKPKEIVLKADLPGFEEDDVSLEIEGDLLTLSGERRDEKVEEDDNRRVVERSFGQFQRSVRLPFAPQESDIKTSYKKGVLTVHVKKPASMENNRRKIPIAREN